MTRPLPRCAALATDTLADTTPDAAAAAAYTARAREAAQRDRDAAPPVTRRIKRRAA